MSKPTQIIDPPGAFEPKADWEAYLEELRAMPAGPEVEEAIAGAEEHLKRMDDTGAAE